MQWIDSGVLLVAMTFLAGIEMRVIPEKCKGTHCDKSALFVGTCCQQRGSLQPLELLSSNSQRQNLGMRKALILVNPNLASKTKTKEAIYQFTRLGASPFHASVRFIGLFSPKATRPSHISYVLGPNKPENPKTEPGALLFPNQPIECV